MLSVGFAPTATAGAAGAEPVVPPGAGAIMPGIDARLLGVPLVAGPGADASADLAAAQTRLATLEAGRQRLQADKHELDARTLALTAVEQKSEATLRRTQALVDRVAAAAYKGAADGLLAVLPSSNVLDLSRRMKLAGQAGTSLRAVAREAADARRTASRAGERAAKESVDVQQQLDRARGADPGRASARSTRG